MNPQPKRAATDWARPDLWKANLTELTVRWDVPCEQWQAAFGDDVQQIRGEDLFGAMHTYTRSGELHQCLLSATRNALGCMITAVYGLLPPEAAVTVPREVRRGPEFTARAGRVTTVISAAARASFAYPDGSGFQPIMPLPFNLKPPGVTHWPMKDITGVRGLGETVHLVEPKRFHYSLELDGSNTLWLVLEYGFTGPPAPGSVNTAIRIGKSIADELMVPPDVELPWGPPRIE
ncbi:MAG: hypothetical protein QM692_11695 [Thermomicrobiales bacterium]